MVDGRSTEVVASPAVERLRSKAPKLLVIAIALLAPGKDAVFIARGIAGAGGPGKVDPVVETEERLAPVRALCRGKSEVGWLSALPPSADGGRHLRASYSLAPLVLVPGTDRPLVLADFEDDARLEAALREKGLRAVARIGPGLALAERGPP
jgi:hypothetical protein